MAKCSFHEDDADDCVSPCPFGMKEPCPLRSVSGETVVKEK